MNFFSHSLSVVFLTTLLTLADVAAAQTAWTSTKSGSPGDLATVYFTSIERGFIAGDDGYLASTIDGGRSWVKYPLNTTENINEIYFRNDDSGYLVAGRKMFITSDGGLTWRETVIYRTGDFRNGTPEFLSIRFADKKRGLVVGSVLNRNGDVVDSLVMRTSDGGETWKRLVVPSKTELFHVDYNGSSHGWIVGDKGVILTTTDSGDTWRLQNSGTDRALYNVDFRDDNEGYAVGGRGTILRTENGGNSWMKVPVQSTETLMRVGFSDDRNGWIVGHGGRVLRTSDKGRNWVRQESGTPSHLYGLFVDKRFGWAVGAKGTLIQYKR